MDLVNSLLLVAATVLSAGGIMMNVKKFSFYGIRTNPWISLLLINFPSLPLQGTCQSAPTSLASLALLVFNFLIPT